MIPYCAYSFWEGNNISWFHIYTVLSLRKYNPTLPIKIYSSIGCCLENPWNTEEHAINIENPANLSIINGIDNIEIIYIDFSKEYNISNSISPVHKADFIRIIKGKEHGGIWFDMDILFIKPIPSDFFSADADIVGYQYDFNVMNYATSTIEKYQPQTFPTGLLGITPNSATINKIADELLAITNSTITTYQIIGPELWFKYINNDNTLFRSCKELYPLSYMQLDDLFNNTIDFSCKNTWGIHWYNGAIESKIAINNYNFNELDEWDSMFGHYLRKVLS